MKVLLINTYDSIGGSSVACNRLLRSLAPYAEVKLLVKHKRRQDDNIIDVGKGFFKSKAAYFYFLCEKFMLFFKGGFSFKNMSKVSIANYGHSIVNHPAVKEADIIHLHWINHGFLSLEEIYKLTELGKPVVWTMHDMWPLTGICHYARGCKHYVLGCGECRFLKNKGENDLSKQVMAKKKKLLTKQNIHYVAVSNWVAKKARTSPIIKKENITVIPNTIDENFCPEDKWVCRDKLQIAKNKKVILFGAQKLNDEIKGASFLMDAIRNIQEKTSMGADLLLILFGNIENDDKFLKQIPCEYLYLGTIYEVNLLKELYSATDVTVVPSHYETFGQTIIESMACGTPAVSFNKGGQTDIIEHKKNGYLAKYADTTDFADGIIWAIEHSSDNEVKNYAMEKVNNCFISKKITEEYLHLYQRLLNKQ